MTDKEKAKAYDEALKKASAAYKDEDRHLKATLERIFPELKESEDEKIKKAIIEFFKSEDDNTTYSLIRKKDIIAWLEKQGKNSTDEIKPRFKVGDWVANKIGDSWHIDSLDKKNYQVSDGEGNCNYFSISNQDEMHLWTIQDAKDCDVLCCKSGWTCIFKAINNHTSTFSSYCFMDADEYFFSVGSESHTLDEIFIKVYNREMYPATKEQRDTFMKAMNDAGYEWDAENKELKKKD